MNKQTETREVSVSFYGVYEGSEYLMKEIRVPLKKNDPCVSFKAAWLKFCMWSQGKMIVSRISMEIRNKENKEESETE